MFSIFHYIIPKLQEVNTMKKTFSVRWRYAITLTLAAGLLTTNCKKEESPPSPTNSGGGGSGSITITVTPGTTPQYSWTGGGAYIVFVERTSNLGTPGWGIMCQGTSTSCITSPVTHGTTPAGTSLTANTEMTLTAGVRYRINVYLGPGGNGGYIDFTP